VRGADLLFAFDEDLHVAWQGAGGVEPRLDGGTVRNGAGFVVSRTPAEEAAVVLDRLERVRRPVVEETGRLHVVVRIEEDGGRALGMQPLADDGRWASRNRCLVNVLQPAAVEVRRGGVGAVLHVGVAVLVGADAGDAHQLLECDACILDPGVGCGDHLARVGVHCAAHARRSVPGRT